MAKITDLNAHESAPQTIRDLYKYYQKLSRDILDSDPDIVDLRRGRIGAQMNTIHLANTISRAKVDSACHNLSRGSSSEDRPSEADVQVWEVEDLPGLRIIPDLLSQKAQEDLLSILLHENLANQRHKTNVHLHHQIPYYATLLEKCGASKPKDRSAKQPSFFHLSPDSQALFQPIDSIVHKPFTVSQFLSRKLRWVTLGGQFDWTGKRYPLEEEPPFPNDVATFIHHIFPSMKPEAAIVNIYRPGDSLSIHRDVSEECDNALVSISLGCEGILVVGIESEVDKVPRSIIVRLRSGDAVFLSGPARFAWHGVPQILPGTSPDWLCNWPASANADGLGEDSVDRYEAWRGWMSNKRVNLSVRQIRD